MPDGRLHAELADSGTGRRAADLARVAVKAAAGAVDLIARPDDGVSILAYHRVGRHTRSQVDLPVARLRARWPGW